MESLERVEHLLAVERYADAVTSLHQWLAQEPGDGFAWSLLAEAHLGLDEPGPALAAAERATASSPDEEWPHRLRSVALLDLGRHEEAVRAAVAAVDAEPLAWQPHVQYALSAVRFPHLVQDCLTATHQALRLAPHEPDTHFAHGVVLTHLERRDEADVAYRRALEIDPGHAPARNNLTLVQKGGLRAELQGYTAALRDLPRLGVARENLVRLAYRVARRIYWAAVLSLVVCLFAAVGAPATTLRAVVGAVMLVGLAGWAVVLWRSVPPGVRTFVRSRLTHDRFLLTTVVLSGLMVAAACGAAFLPLDPVRFAHLVVRPLGLANVVVVVWGYVRASAD